MTLAFDAELQTPASPSTPSSPERTGDQYILGHARLGGYAGVIVPQSISHGQCCKNPTKLGWTIGIDEVRCLLAVDHAHRSNGVSSFHS